MTRFDTISEIQMRREAELIGALLTNRSVAAAAREANISLSTAMRYLRSETFQQAYKEARNAVLEATSNLLISSSLEAVEFLRRVILGQQKPSPGEIASARAVLEFGIKTRELQLESRIDAVERIVTEKLK